MIVSTQQFRNSVFAALKGCHTEGFRCTYTDLATGPTPGTFYQKVCFYQVRMPWIYVHSLAKRLQEVHGRITGLRLSPVSEGLQRTAIFNIRGKCTPDPL